MQTKNDIDKQTQEILKMFSDFGIKLKLHEVVPGPNSSYFTFQMVSRVRMKEFQGYIKDLQYVLGTNQISIEAPMKNQSLIKIEVANKEKEIFYWKDIIKTKEFKNSKILQVPLGYSYNNKLLFLDLTTQPHIIIGGTTGSGKSILINNWICTLLLKTTANQVRMILADPKRVELNYYAGIGHLLTDIIYEPKKIISALNWTVREMENRYKLFAKTGVINIDGYNQKNKKEPLPYVLFIIDELADLMMFAKKEAEELIIRIAQLARATGIHLILSTQLPSSSVLTGMLTANIPSRIAFATASAHDSKVILDMTGAEKLTGRGDGLYLGPTEITPIRFQSPLITEDDINKIIEPIKKQFPEIHYSEEVMNQATSTIGDQSDKDPLFDQALNAIYESGLASASFLQRLLSIGYSRAARLLDQLHEAGYIGPAQGSKPRVVFKRDK